VHAKRQKRAFLRKLSCAAGVVLIGALDASAELLFRADAAVYARKGAPRGEPSQLAQSRNVTR
jgi:hypothetical protein